MGFLNNTKQEEHHLILKVAMPDARRRSKEDRAGGF